MKARLLLLFVLLSSFLFITKLRAAETEPNNTPATANVLPLNGSNTGAITASDVDWYKVTTNSDGAITLNLTETGGQYYVSLQMYDADGTTKLGSRIDVVNGTNTVTIDGMAAGTYYVSVFAYYDGQTPTYSISDILTVPAQANDAEPNGTVAQSLTLPLNGSHTGHVGYYYNHQRDTVDWYKVTANADGRIRLYLTGGNGNYISCQLYDADGTTKLGNRLDIVNGTATTDIDGLAAGTYYVAVFSYYQDQFEPYVIADSLFTPVQANDAEPNGTVAQSLTLPLNAGKTGHVGYYYNHQRDTLDWYKLTTNSDGRIRLYLTGGNGNYVSCQLYDADGTTKLGSRIDAINNGTFTTDIDGLAAGIYYVAVSSYYQDQFEPYAIADSLFTPVSNDIEPNGTVATAHLLPIDTTTNGHIGYYYNHQRDTVDWYKIVTPKNGAVKLIFTGLNGNYATAQLYNYNGTVPLGNRIDAINGNAGSTIIDGLGAGTYYIAVYSYYQDQFEPYTLTDSLLTYNPGDTVPNAYFSQAATIPANRTVYGDVGFLFKAARDTTDTWKINYTGSDGNLNLTFNMYPHFGDGGLVYTRLQVFKDTSAQYIYQNDFLAPSSTFSLTGLTQGYYYIRVYCYYQDQFNAYSIADNFTQVNIAAIAPQSISPSADTCGGNSITYALSGSHAPYGVQLYRNGVRYDSVNVAGNTATFSHLPAGNYYATVYGDGATDAAYGTSATTTFLPPTPKNLTTTNIGVHTAKLNWAPFSCVKSYRVQYRLSSATTWTTLDDANDAVGTYTLTGLASYTNYTWRVASVDTAQGAALPSAYSDTLQFLTLSDTARIVRSSKTNGTTCNSSTLVYTLSNSVAPYMVQLYRYGAAYSTSVQATGTATYTGLPTGIYYATATGTGSGGSYGTSGIDTILPPVSTGLDTMMLTSNTAEVTWTPLSCVSYFTIQYRKLGAASWTTVQAAGNQSMDTLTGLQADTLYEWHLASGDSTAGTMLMSVYSISDTFRTKGVLPVTLISFTAKPVNNTVQVSWQTANEINNSYYVVQRSTDGIAFSTVGTVQAGAQHQYSFTDNSPVAGKSYYRLRQVDRDGRYMDSKVVLINFTGSSLLTLYPNPAVNVVHINLSAQGKATLTVYDNNGKAVMQKVVSDGTSTEHLNVSSLAAGTYTVLLQQADGSHQSARFVKP